MIVPVLDALLESTLDLVNHFWSVFWSIVLELSPVDVAVILVLLFLPGGLIVAIHEAGHAVAALLVGSSIRELRVGETDEVVFGLGAFRLRLGRIGPTRDPGELVIERGSMRAWQMIVVSLAGPAANLTAAGMSVPLALQLNPAAAVLLLCWGGWNVFIAFGSLRHEGDLDEVDEWNDRSWVRAAWKYRHFLPAETSTDADPMAGNSVPPPSSSTNR